MIRGALIGIAVVIVVWAFCGAVNELWLLFCGGAAFDKDTLATHLTVLGAMIGGATGLCIAQGWW